MVAFGTLLPGRHISLQRESGAHMVLKRRRGTRQLLL